MEKYDHKAIEPKWQKYWEKEGLHKTPDNTKGKSNFYLLVEFPYPSGNLHVGHWYAFSVPDILARFHRMNGRNVLYPIGFDAFGLPAENAAIKNKINPRTWTYDNMDYMRKQIRSMGASFDWSREVVTCDPDYYRWTQWQFLQFFKNGLAYRKDTPVNWCPSCKTVLANEQVVDGHCERCGSEVEQRNMLQWNLKITNYADRLVDDLDKLNWPEQIKDSQRNWIGRSIGAEFDFSVVGVKEKITVFTTRADTLFGATYLVLAPEHGLIEQLKGRLSNWDEIVRYIVLSKKRTEIERTAVTKDKTGVELKGVKAINPATKLEIPIFIADYVLAHYGTGAIMAVPAHDDRDLEFAKSFNLPIKPVIAQIDSAREAFPGLIRSKIESIKESGFSHAGDGILINSGKFDGLPNQEAKAKIVAEVGGREKKTYRLRDWVVSRQRYWGVPIPIIHCEKCGDVPVGDTDLPVLLPDVEDYLPAGDGRSPLAKVREWVEVKCPTCKGKAERETDTFDTFVDSSWYYLWYTDPRNKKEFASRKKMDLWMPVNLYSGGAEHTTMHVLYSRFWQKALFDLGLVKDEEPYTRRMNRGLIMGPDGQKMSKSRGNVIDPDTVVAELGADTVRMYLAFIGPYHETGTYPWSPEGISGVRRFLDRVWRLQERIGTTSTEAVKRSLHVAIKKVTEDIPALKFNTAIAAFMTFLNEAEKGTLATAEYKLLLRALAPFAPHLTEELWRTLEEKGSIHTEDWPVFDAALSESATVRIGIQVNGKVRETLEVVKDESEAEILKKALAHPRVVKWVEGKEIIKKVYVPGRLLSLVVSE